MRPRTASASAGRHGVFATGTGGYGAGVSEQTSKHGPGQDEYLKHETRGLVQGGKSTHVEEWRDPEPAGEDQDMADRGIIPEDRRGTPAGMTTQDIDERADIAQALGTRAFPSDRDGLVEIAEENQATDRVLSRLRSLPAGESFENMQDVARALGLHVETQRF